MKTDNTAVIFFSRTQASESQSKNLDPSFRQNAKIVSAIYERTLNTLRKTGFDIIHYNEHLQKAESFGENIIGAFQYGFDEGYDQLILVGNDCVELSTSEILNSADHLSKTGVVLGPDYRGGLYLIGLNRESFAQSLSNIRQLPWQEQKLWKECLLAFSDFFQLRRLHDINNVDDLRQFIGTDHSAFSVKIRALLSQKSSVKRNSTSHYIICIKLSFLWHRGPPVAAA